MRAVGDAGQLLDPQSPEFPPAATLPEFFSDTPRQGIHLGLFLALFAAALTAFLLRKTTFGFRLKVVGQNPVAARFAGMNVARVSFATLALSGALAGLAGGAQIAGSTLVLFPDVGTDGLGFAGIAVALLGRLSPVGVVAAALFFGLLATAFKALERSPLEVHAAAALAVQGAIVLFVLITTSPNWSTRFARSKLSRAL
jgi:simple sugar transport system permease protein